MGLPRRNLSEFQGVWLFTLFDLPVDDKKARKRYTRFRKLLIKQGFYMVQFSVYARYFVSQEASEACRGKIQAAVPPDGHVRLLMVTDHQFGKMQVFHGKTESPAEKPPEQLLLF